MGSRSSHLVRAVAIALGIAAAILRPGVAAAQEMDVPTTLQAALFSKVIAFDRNAPSGSGTLVVGIIYQSGNRVSDAAADEVARALQGVKVGVRAIQVVRIDLDRGGHDLAAALAKATPYAAYVAPLRAVEIGDVVGALRHARVRSFTGVTEYVEAGLAVSVRSEADRPKLLINLTAARAEGAEYQAALLQLAEVRP